MTCSIYFNLLLFLFLSCWGHTSSSNTPSPPSSRSKRVADMLRGLLCYLETDSFSHQPISGWEKQSAAVSLVHLSCQPIPVLMAVVWPCCSQLYWLPFLCSDLFSVAVHFHAHNHMDTHINTQISTNPLNVTTPPRSLGNRKTWSSW